MQVRVASVLAGLIAWEVLGRILHTTIFAYPSTIGAAFFATIRQDDLLPRLGASLGVLSLGLSLAIVVGIPLGVLIARKAIMEYALDTYINALYATPAVAFVPLIGMWFGFQTSAKVVVVFFFCVFPILINTYQGVKNIDARLVEVARSFCSGESSLWRDLILPSAAPFILAGIRLAIGRGLIGMVIAEVLLAAAGIGYLILQYMNTFRTDRLFVTIVLLMVMGVGLTAVLRNLERRIAPWLHETRGEP
ncbi:MAG: ABC transporter permease [Armatimonadota bacterium]